MFDKAVLLASLVHLGQRDKGGRSYILHPLRVALQLRTADEELMSIAVLHDAIEDYSEMSVTRLRNEGFSERVISALELLTHDPKVVYDEYIVSGQGDTHRIWQSTEINQIVGNRTLHSRWTCTMTGSCALPPKLIGQHECKRLKMWKQR